MKWGVPAEGWYCNLLGSLFGGMILGNPLYWLMMGPIHLVMRGISNKNPNFFREWRVWMNTRSAIAGGTLWAMRSRSTTGLPAGTTLYGRRGA